MATNTPIVLQLAPLPRTQIGPFLILGVEKDASREVIEAAWAEKVKQARRGQVKTPLEDINWAREMLTSKDSRIRCDAIALRRINFPLGDDLFHLLHFRIVISGERFTAHRHFGLHSHDAPLVGNGILLLIDFHPICGDEDRVFLVEFESGRAFLRIILLCAIIRLLDIILLGVILRRRRWHSVTRQ